RSGESWARESTGQGVKQGACRLGHGLMDLLEFAASGTGLAGHTLAAFAVEATSPAGLASAPPGRAVVAARAGPATASSGYTRHDILLVWSTGGHLPVLPARGIPLCPENGQKSNSAIVLFPCDWVRTNGSAYVATSAGFKLAGLPGLWRL